MNSALLINPTAMEAGLIAAAKARALPPARAEAFEAFAKTGMPHKRMEAWKWTDLRQALRDDLASTSPDNDVIAPSIFGGVGAYEITIMNSAAEWTGAPPKGVTLARKLSDAPLPEIADDHPLSNLAHAFAEQLIEIRVEPGASIEKPILLRRIAGAGSFHSRLSIDVGADARATLIESFDGAGEYFSNSFTDVSLAAGAALTRLVLQSGSAKGVETSLFAARLGAEATFHQTALLFGALAGRLETRIVCEGEGAEVLLMSAAALEGQRHADLTSLVKFDAEHCTARQRHKSALKDRARGVFQGKFLVSRGAQKTDAQMTANALLLSDTAEANHKPELEIYADDVQCAHGSTAGALDDDALFYMRQRGLDEHQARALLIEAFLGEAFDDMPHPAVQHIFRQRVGRWLEAAA